MCCFLISAVQVITLGDSEEEDGYDVTHSQSMLGLQEEVLFTLSLHFIHLLIHFHTSLHQDLDLDLEIPEPSMDDHSDVDYLLSDSPRSA